MIGPWSMMVMVRAVVVVVVMVRLTSAVLRGVGLSPRNSRVVSRGHFFVRLVVVMMMATGEISDDD